MRTVCTLIIGLLLCSNLTAQTKLDHIWLFGDDTGPEDSIPHFGGSVMDFTGDTLQLYKQEREMPFKQTNSSICDTAGNLLFYTNGVYLANAQHDTIPGGGCCLNPNGLTGGIEGHKIGQATLILPYPEKEGKYIVLHEGGMLVNLGFLDIAGGPLYSTVVDMEKNGGAGQVESKNIPVIADTLDFGKITATRHANGRDWWATVPAFRSENKFSLLITADSMSVVEQEIGEPIANGIGQAAFSPDGHFYANISLNGFVDCAAHIFRFNRCSGTFSDPVYIPVTCNSASAGLAFSPNSRFLYLLVNTEIYQVDLWAEDWAASLDTVAIYDGYEEPIPGFDDLALSTRFFMAQLAPDGKIYINTTNSVRSLHVINTPDLPGDSCDVQQHSLQLPTLNAFSLPNFPNYRLGKLPGSPCDTLGPVAGFSAAPEGLSVTFSDESLRSPAAWFWDFGDGNTSTAASPVHAYAAEGAYEVCLYVSNAYGTDTLCKTVEVMLSSTEEVLAAGQALVYPNPASGQFHLRLPAGWLLQGVELYHSNGQLARLYSPGQSGYSLEGLPAGAYFLRLLWDSGARVVKLSVH